MNQPEIKIRSGLNNQAAGLIPLLLLILLNNFFTYIVSFTIAVIFCLLSLFLFWGLFRGRIYQFMLLITSTTLVLYSVFLFLRLEPMLFLHSPLITEWLLVAVLALVGFFKRTIVYSIRRSSRASFKRVQFRTSLNEFFYVAQMVQNLYTLHLFIILFYIFLPENHQNLVFERVLYREAPLFIGLGIMVYEQVRLALMRHQLKREAWLPVLDEKGKVIGRIARSVSLSLQAKRYCHPVVRVAVVYDRMLYLVKRGDEEVVSPQQYDYPYYGYVLFKQTLDQAVKEVVGGDTSKHFSKPRLLVRYTFKNERVHQLVSLYLLTLKNEQEWKLFMKERVGKLWPMTQIEDNLSKGVFSDYFEKEYPYLQNTVLLAKQYITRPTTSDADLAGAYPAQSLPPL